VLCLACGISFVLYLHRYTWGFIKADLEKEFHWDPVTFGWLDGLFPASYGLAQIPSGIVCDWFGAHFLLGSSVVLWSLALGGVALATGLTSMAIARLTFGVTQAGCYPVLTKVSKNWFPVSERTTAQGLIATFFGRLGGAGSFFLFGTVLVGWLGMPWKEAIGVFTLLGIACGILFLVLFRNSPPEHPWANKSEAALIVKDDTEAAYTSHSYLHWGAMVRSVSIWFLFVRAFVSNMADVLYVYWVPLYLRNEKGLKVEDAGILAALPLLSAAVGGVVSGALQSRLIQQTGNRRWARSGTAMAGKLLASGFMLASLAFDNAVVITAIFIVVKFFTDMEQPAEWGTVSDVAGRNAATVFACVNTLGAVGGFVASPLIGLVLQSFGDGTQPTAAGWNAVFVLIALEYLIAAGAWLFIDCGKPIGASALKD
jgi:MFS family permease